MTTPEPMSAERLAEVRKHTTECALAFGVIGLTEAEAEREDLLAEVDRLRAAELKHLALIDALADPDDCWFDDHGGCQAHGYLGLQPGEVCPQAEAKAILAGRVFEVEQVPAGES